MILKDLLRRVFRAAYYVLNRRRGVERTVNGQTYRFSAYVARGIPRVIPEPMLNVWRDLTRGASVAFEVGAHIGTYAIICSREMHEGSKIYGFEPSPETYRVLCDTARINRLQKGNADILPVNKACGEKAGVVEFVRDGLKETNRLAVGGNSHGNVRVEMVTLDEFCGEAGVIPDVMKIDAEGAELIVLKGMPRVLREGNPVILIELHHILWEEFGVTAAALLGVIHGAGYKLYSSGGDELTLENIGSAGFGIMKRPETPRRW
jgi:FkbM family methyltransferase